MAIVIGSDDIYGVSNQNILSNNRIDGISYQNKVVSVSEEGSTDTTLATVTEADNGNALTDNNSDFKVSVGTTTTNYTNKIYTWTRIETYYSTFSFPVSRSYGLLKGKNLTFNSTVQAIENESPTRYKRNLDVLNTSVSLFPSISSFGSDIQNSTTTGLLADGVASLSFNPGGIAGEASVKQAMSRTISINGYDDSSMSGYYKVTVRYPTKVSGTYGTRTVTYTDGSIISQYVYYVDFVQITSIDVYLSYSDVEVSDSGNLVKLGTFDSTSNTFSLETNSLIQETTTYNDQNIASYNAAQELSDWQNGRESVDIDVMIGEFYDENGNLVISTQDEALPMTFNIGDVVVPLTIDESGNETGLSNILANTFSPVAYKVYGIQTYYDGACWQKLNLISATQAEVCYVLLDVEDGVDVTITRVSTASGTDSIGVLRVPIVNAGDVITIELSYSGDKEYYNIYCTVDGAVYEAGSEINITGTVEVYVRATTFEVLTWEQIDSICSEGLEGEYFSVGDSKTIFIDEGFEESSLFNQYHDVVILGINHDTLTDGGTATLTIGMTDCLIDSSYSYYWAEETGTSWENSLLRNDFIPNTILPQFPEDLQAVIKTVVKGSFGSYLEETLFPLAVTEVMGKNEQTSNEVVESLGSGAFGDLMDDGDIYEYWKSVKDGSVANNRRKTRQYVSEKIDGVYQEDFSPYFTRSYVETALLNKLFVCFDGSGEIGGLPTTYSSGVSLAFCVGHSDSEVSSSLKFSETSAETLTLTLDSGTLTVNWGDGEKETLDTIGEYSLSHTYSSSGDYSVTIYGDGTWTPKSYCFRNNSTLTELRLGDHVTEVSSSAFYNCTALVSLNIEGAPKLNNSAFYGCSSLKTVAMDKVTYIGTSCFSGCNALTTVSMLNVKEIYGFAFRESLALTKVFIPNTCTYIANRVFECTYGSDFKSLTIYCEADEAGDDWGSLWNVRYSYDTTYPATTKYGVTYEEYESL